MKPILPLTSASLFLLIFAGCTAHYRQSLRDFRRGVTSSYTQRTLDWTRQAETLPVASPITLTSATASLSALGAQQQAQDPFICLAAQVLSLEPDYLVQARARLDQPAKLGRVFKAQVRWGDLAVAVALYNPEVQAARADWQATLRQYEQADYLEGLLGQFLTFTRTLNIETGEPRNQQMAQTWFPYPSTIAWKGEMVRQMARMAELDWQKMLRDNLVMAGDRFFQYQYLARAQATAQENVNLLNDFVKVLDERYRTGLIPQSNLLRGQNELAQQRNTLLDLESQARTSQAQINALIGRPANAPLGPPDLSNLPLPALNYVELNETAQAHRQEILAQQAAIERTQAAIRMSEVMNRPPASQGYSSFERGMMPESSAGTAGMTQGSSGGMGGGDSGTGAVPTFGVKPRSTAPRYGFAQAEAYLAETRQRLQGDRLRLENLRLQTQLQARSSLEDVDIAKRKVSLLEQVTLPQNQSIYNISLSDYTSGNTTFVELLDAERELINTRLMVHEAHRDLNQAIIKLAGVTGYLVAR